MGYLNDRQAASRLAGIGKEVKAAGLDSRVTIGNSPETAIWVKNILSRFLGHFCVMLRLHDRAQLTFLSQRRSLE